MALSEFCELEAEDINLKEEQPEESEGNQTQVATPGDIEHKKTDSSNDGPDPLTGHPSPNISYEGLSKGIQHSSLKRWESNMY